MTNDKFRASNRFICHLSFPENRRFLPNPLKGALSLYVPVRYNTSVKSNIWAKASRLLLLTAGSFAVAYLGGGLIAAWMLVRPARRQSYDCLPFFRHGKLQPLTLYTSNGLKLHAWVLLSRRAAPEDWVLILHGYRSDRGAAQSRARFFSRRGFNVLILHFRGHGSSDRAFISYGFHERADVKAAFDFVNSLLPGMRIGIDGISMGAATAALAVGRDDIHPQWMILESCYDNIRHALANRLASRFGTSLTPFLAWPVEFVVEYLVKLRAEDLDPAKALQKSHCPVLLMGGDSEVVLKMVETEYLYGCIPEPKRLVVFPGAGHQDLLAYDPRRYSRAVNEFLRDLVRNTVPGQEPGTGSQVLEEIIELPGA